MVINVVVSIVPFQDKELSCHVCQRAFIFTAGEQEFYAAKNLANEPKRCPGCRVSHRLQREGKDPGYSAEVPCAECGALTVVPFKPSGARPVLCSPCHHRKKNEGTTN